MQKPNLISAQIEEAVNEPRLTLARPFFQFAARFAYIIALAAASGDSLYAFENESSSLFSAHQLNEKEVSSPSEEEEDPFADDFLAFEELPPLKKDLVAQESPASANTEPVSLADQAENEKILINYNNVSIAELIRFISRITGKNFVYEEQDLQFNVTIVSEEPTSIQNVMTALLQILRIHGLSLLEQGNNVIIHRNDKISSISQVVGAQGGNNSKPFSEIITRVISLNTLSPERAILLIRPLVSESAILEEIPDSSNIVVTDITANVEKIDELLKNLDAPVSGLIIGQYQVVNGILESLLPLAEQIMAPIADKKPLVFVPHIASNSVFIVSTPFLVERAISVLTNLDKETGSTHIFSKEELKFSEIEAQKALEQAAANSLSTQGTISGGTQKGAAGGLSGSSAWTQGLPLGHIQRTQFYIQKLRYRKGDQLVTALGRIAESLEQSGQGNIDLVSTIHSIQWIEASNSLIFTGTSESLLKVRELINEIDAPLRQVFIEMLIIETTLDNSLDFGVNWGTRGIGENESTSQIFSTDAGAINAGLNTTGSAFSANASVMTVPAGNAFSMGIIGQELTKGGLPFDSIAALVRALHDDTSVDIVLNPKILTEDNSPAEIFVGTNERFQTQSISNDNGSILTNNFEYRDVGTTLKVTPLISSNDIVTLEIKEEVSRVLPGTNTSGGGITNVAPGPSTSKSTTTTKVHVPNKFFIILSGMMNDSLERGRTQIPCLGAVPIAGAAASSKHHRNLKRNTMIFIRPEIIDTEDQIDYITCHQQKIWHQKKRTNKMWQLEVDEGLDWLNIKQPDNTFDDFMQFNP